MTVTEMKTKAVGIVRVGSDGTPFQEQISGAKRGHQDFLLGRLVEGDTITQDREGVQLAGEALTLCLLWDMLCLQCI